MFATKINVPIYQFSYTNTWFTVVYNALIICVISATYIVMCCVSLSCSKMEKTALLIAAVTLCLLQVCVAHVVSARKTLTTKSNTASPGTPQPLLGYG